MTLDFIATLETSIYSAKKTWKYISFFKSLNTKNTCFEKQNRKSAFRADLSNIISIVEGHTAQLVTKIP